MRGDSPTKWGGPFFPYKKRISFHFISSSCALAAWEEEEALDRATTTTTVIVITRIIILIDKRRRRRKRSRGTSGASGILIMRKGQRGVKKGTTTKRGGDSLGGAYKRWSPSSSRGRVPLSSPNSTSKKRRKEKTKNPEYAQN